MKILRSKLYELEMRQRAEKVNEAHKGKKDIAWGSPDPLLRARAVPAW